VTEQTIAVLRAKNKAYRWPKGTSGNPDGQARLYHEARKLARDAAPEMMQVLIDLALDDEEDPRVRSVCAVAVLDRGGIRPIDKLEADLSETGDMFDPRAYSPDELKVIEVGLKLMLEKRSGSPEPADIPPGRR